MSGQHGGPRTPRNPAPASGPGRLSKRTDGGPSQKVMLTSGGDYGDRTALSQQEHGAAMSQQNSVTPMPVQQPQAPAAGGGTPYAGGDFGAPTARPNEPVTQGVDVGPGDGSEVLQAPPQSQGTGAMTALLQQLSTTDTTGVLAQLYQAASARNA